MMPLIWKISKVRVYLYILAAYAFIVIVCIMFKVLKIQLFTTGNY